MYLLPAHRTTAWIVRIFSVVFSVFWFMENLGDIRILFVEFSLTDFKVLFFIAFIVFALLMFYWLFMLTKKGWVMLLIYFTISTVIYIYMALFYESSWSELPHNRIPDITRIIIGGLVFYFFNRKDVLDIFRVSVRFRKKFILFFVVPLSVIIMALVFIEDYTRPKPPLF